MKKDGLTKKGGTRDSRVGFGDSSKPAASQSKDRLSRERRSWNMSRIRGKDTTPEKIVRSLLHKMGYRFRLHVRIPVTLSASTGERDRVRCRKPFSPQSHGGHGEERKHQLGTGNLKPETPTSRVRAVSADILLPKYKTAIFVHGCFWHRHRGCKNCTTPTRRRAWWLRKLEGNATRDIRNRRRLCRLGWRPLVVWECETEGATRLEQLRKRLAKLLAPAQ